MAKQPTKVTVNILGKYDTFLLSNDGQPLTTPFARYTAKDMQDLANTKSGTFTMSLRLPDRKAITASSLKVAYLAVFSLLGPLEGYGYIHGQALRAVRQQIVDPLNHGGAIRKYVIKTPDNLPDRDIFLVSRPVPCWVVKVENQTVLLPYSGDSSTSQPLSELSKSATQSQVLCTGHASWMFQTFGAAHVIRVHLKGATEFDSLVGLTIQGTLPNGETVKGTCVRHVGESAALICEK